MRCTAFPGGATKEPIEYFFEVFSQAEPEKIVHDKKSGVVTAVGEFSSGQLTVQTQPGRIDYLLGPAPSDVLTLPKIGPLDETWPLFTERILAWLVTGPELTRLAFGTLALSDVDDRHSGYELLNKLLPRVDLDVEHSSDFNFQINRPRLHNLGPGSSVTINRLTKWSVAMLSALPVGLVESGALFKKHACRLELDFNTAPRDAILPVEALPDIWKTLSAMAHEVTEKGDIP